MTYKTNLEQERRMLFCLNQIQQLGAVSICSLGEYFGSYSSLFNIEETALRESGILRETQIQAFCEGKKRRSEYLEEYEKLAERKIRFITPLDPEYPKERVQIISGLALGIDGAAHQGALKAGEDTYGILGCGVNICYPSAHYKLYGQMLTHGSIISEFPLDSGPIPMHFPMRNRIISGLSDAVLVVEAKEKSGSLITAELGLEQGKEIFAVPGRITDHLSGGCNRLIQQGAHMAISPNDILEYLGVKCEKRLIIHEKNANALAKPEKMVYACLDFKAKHLEEISDRCRMSISECMGILLELELQGYVFRTANHYYGKKI